MTRHYLIPFGEKKLFHGHRKAVRDLIKRHVSNKVYVYRSKSGKVLVGRAIKTRHGLVHAVMAGVNLHHNRLIHHVRAGLVHCIHKATWNGRPGLATMVIRGY